MVSLQYIFRVGVQYIFRVGVYGRAHSARSQDPGNSDLLLVGVQRIGANTDNFIPGFLFNKVKLAASFK